MELQWSVCRFYNTLPAVLVQDYMASFVIMNIKQFLPSSSAGIDGMAVPTLVFRGS